jgi:hypothetical protein
MAPRYVDFADSFKRWWYGLYDRFPHVNVDALLRWWYGTPDKNARVVRVLAFDADDVRVEYLAWDPAKFAPAWEEHVRQVTNFEPGRLEIRILQNQRKRRVVLYPGTPCDPEFPVQTKAVIVNATLMPRAADPDAKRVDVTKRVRKYAGNALQSISHMFPFDDPDDIMERWSHIRMLDLTMSVVDVPISRESRQ